jgi:hypothetical protein
VSIYGRAAQGVRLMRVAQDSRVISIACTEKEDEENEPTDAPASENTTTSETAE